MIGVARSHLAEFLCPFLVSTIQYIKLQIWTPERTLINIFIPRWVTLVCRSDRGVVRIEKQEGVNTSLYLFIRLERKVRNSTFEGNYCVSSCTDQIQNKHDNKEIL